MDTYHIPPYKTVPRSGPRIDVLVVCMDGDRWYGRVLVDDLPGRPYGPYARKATAQGVCTRAARRIWQQARACP